LNNKDLKKALKKYFGHDDFRQGQEEIIISVIDGEDCMVVMPTGGGKSLCYQLPAIMHSGTAIVVSPLIALMKDQVDALQQAGVAAAFINSTMTWGEIQETFNKARQGDYKLLYIAPERLESRNFIDFLMGINISFIAIDEAHCISEWGHDFRPSYMNIAGAIGQLEKVPIIALTATATPDVRKDIVKSLNLKNCKTFVRGFDRPNLNYFTMNSTQKAKDAYEILRNDRDASAIIYCGSRKKVDDIAKSLNQLGIKRVRPYHAGMGNQIRKANQDWFILKENAIIVATNAFGMGIDKPNVRNVIHCDLTQTIEAYYQEAGRAGRDGKPANCYLLYNHQDRKLQEFFINCTYPDYDALVDTYNYLYDLMNIALGQKIVSPFYLNMGHLANRLQKPIYAISAIISLFKRQGILKQNKEGSKPQLKFKADKKELLEYLKKHAGSDTTMILEQLLRNVSSEAFSDLVEFDIQKLVKILKIKSEDFELGIQKLVRNNLVQYQAAASANSYVLAKERMSDDHMPIDFHGLYLRKKNAISKLNKVLDYADTDKCKRNYILEYFSDDSHSENCGRCTSCLGEGKHKFKKHKEKYIDTVVKEAIETLGETVDIFTLADLLKGNNTQKINSEKLYKNEFFAKAKDYTFLNIRRVISQHQRSFVKKESPVKKVVKPVEFSTETDENPELYEKLLDFRSKIAAKYNLLERSVLSDAAIKRTIAAEVRSIDELIAIKGISKKTISLYGENIVDILNGKPLEEDESSQTEIAIKKMTSERKSLEFMSNHLGIGKADLARTIQNMIEKGTEFALDYMIDKNSLSMIKKFLIKSPKAPLREIRSDMNIDMDYPLLRVHVAVARKKRY
jgi:ATP-dependent DNA helicase RecQ